MHTRDDDIYASVSYASVSVGFMRDSLTMRFEPNIFPPRLERAWTRTFPCNLPCTNHQPNPHHIRPQAAATAKIDETVAPTMQVMNPLHLYLLSMDTEVHERCRRSRGTSPTPVLSRAVTSRRQPTLSCSTSV